MTQGTVTSERGKLGVRRLSRVGMPSLRSTPSALKCAASLPVQTRWYTTAVDRSGSCSTLGQTYLGRTHTSA
jgi:hypothetical protein